MLINQQGKLYGKNNMKTGLCSQIQIRFYIYLCSEMKFTS
ncbi:unnamed protein product [Paramecium primaurelia]|nr:unnamed protein product [Paramecium primaurelia]